MKYPESTKVVQEAINQLYLSCEEIKDQMALLKFQYQRNLEKLNTLCKESGLSANVDVRVA